MTMLIIDTERMSERTRQIALAFWSRVKRFRTDVVDYARYLAKEVRNPDKDKELTMADLLDTQENVTLKARKSTTYAKVVQRGKRNGRSNAQAKKSASDPGSDASHDSDSDSAGSGVSPD